VFAGKKSAQIREILISESAWEEMTCLFAPSLGYYRMNIGPHLNLSSHYFLRYTAVVEISLYYFSVLFSCCFFFSS
ncbi:hypothetical protein WFL50_20430, partial [Yersinia enterocolitica]